MPLPSKPDRGDVLVAIATHLGDRSACWRWIPSDETDVFRLESERLAPHIVKIARDGAYVVAHEQLAYPALRAMGFTEFPEIELTQADIESVDATFMLMPETPWRPHAELWRDEPAAFRERWQGVWDLLRASGEQLGRDDVAAQRHIASARSRLLA